MTGLSPDVTVNLEAPEFETSGLIPSFIVKPILLGLFEQMLESALKDLVNYL